MKQIFTFGEGQHHAGCFVEIEGADAADCRIKMLRAFGTKWAFQYDTRKAAGVDRWELVEIDLSGNVVRATEYLVPIAGRRAAHIVDNGFPLCRSTLIRAGYRTTNEYDGKVCQNCIARRSGGGFGRTVK